MFFGVKKEATCATWESNWKTFSEMCPSEVCHLIHINMSYISAHFYTAKISMGSKSFK